MASHQHYDETTVEQNDLFEDLENLLQSDEN